MADRGRWLRGVATEVDLRGGALFGGGTSGVSALKRPDPEPEPELEPEKEDVNAPNIAVLITVQLGFRTRDGRTDSAVPDCPSYIPCLTISYPYLLHHLHP
jgi:hypothetical protein